MVTNGHAQEIVSPEVLGGYEESRVIFPIEARYRLSMAVVGLVMQLRNKNHDDVFEGTPVAS